MVCVYFAMFAGVNMMNTLFMFTSFRVILSFSLSLCLLAFIY